MQYIMQVLHFLTLVLFGKADIHENIHENIQIEITWTAFILLGMNTLSGLL